jgi:Type II secretion system (T2SS), protein M subtype b
MKLQERDLRALRMLAVALPLFLIGWWATSEEDVPAPVVPAITNIPMAEQRLTRVRQLAAAVPGKQEALQKVTGELQEREKGLISADTAAQAQEQLLQIVRRLGKSQNIDMRNTEIGPLRVFGAEYGEVVVSINFESHIDQLVNLLADFTSQKEIIGVNDMRIGAANPKLKTMPVRLTIAALVRKELVPDKKAGAI